MQNQSEKKRVLIAGPTLGLDPDPNRWLNSLMVILNSVRREGFEHAIFFPYRQTWWPANNQIWNVAFEHKFDYILRIDDDIHEVADDAFKLLLEADKVVIGAAYPNRRWPFFTSAMNRTDSEKNLVDICLTDDRCLKYIVEPEGEDKVVECELIGFGMTLIKVSPFKYLERPMYKGEESVPDDTYFAQVCMDQGIKQYVHFGVKIAHAHVNYRNNGYLFNAGVIERQAAQSQQVKNENVASII